MGNTERSSTHFACRGFKGFEGVGMLSVEVVLFTAVSPTRRAPVKTGWPPLCVLRDIALRSLSPPPCNPSYLVPCVPGRQIQAAGSRERWRVRPRHTPPRLPLAVVRFLPARP